MFTWNISSSGIILTNNKNTLALPPFIKYNLVLVLDVVKELPVIDPAVKFPPHVVLPALSIVKVIALLLLL